MAKIFSILLCALMFLSQPVAAFAWRSSLYPAGWYPGFTDSQGRALPDFSYAGYHRGEKPLPNITGPVFDVRNYGANGGDSQDDTQAIQNAINAAGIAGGGVVYLPTGTYYVTPKIYGTQSGNYPGSSWALLVIYDNVVLRGDGPEQTHIFYNSTQSAGGGIIFVSKRPYGVAPNSWAEVEAFNLNLGEWDQPQGSEVTVSQDLLQPTTTIPLQSVAGFAVGDQIVIRTHKTAEFLADLNNPGGWSTNSLVKGLMYQREILSVNAQTNTITVDIPTRYPIKLSYQPTVYKIKPPVKEVGIENLSLAMREVTDISTNRDATIRSSYVINFHNALNSWMRNVSSYPPLQNTEGYGYSANSPDELKYQIHSYGFEGKEVRNLTLENVHFANPQTHGEGGNGYMFIPYGNDNLFKDCSAFNGRHNISFKGMESSGNVFLNCRIGFTPNYPSSNAAIFGKTLNSDFHMWFSHANLFDNLILDGDSYLAQNRGTTSSNGQITSSGNVWWNTTVDRSHIRGGAAILTDQWAWGYVIGMKGTQTANLLNLYSSTENPGDPHRPDFYEPVTIMSGDGQGMTLEPQSLYLDQLARRLGGSYVTPTPTSSPTFTISDLKLLISRYLSNNDSSYYPIDAKVNMLDGGYVLRYLRQ